MNAQTLSNSKLLVQSAQRGDVLEVQRLISVSDPKFDGSIALYWSALNGHSACVKLLIPVSDPKDRDSRSLKAAAENGHTACVKLLLPVSNPKDNESLALQVAYIWGHTECADLLLEVSDPTNALHELKNDFSGKPQIWLPLEHKIALQQKFVLNKNVVDGQNDPRVPPARKI